MHIHIIAVIAETYLMFLNIYIYTSVLYINILFKHPCFQHVQRTSPKKTYVTFLETMIYHILFIYSVVDVTYLAKLVPVTPISLWFMVDLSYIYGIHGVYKPTNITGGAPACDTQLSWTTWPAVGIDSSPGECHHRRAAGDPHPGYLLGFADDAPWRTTGKLRVLGMETSFG